MRGKNWAYTRTRKSPSRNRYTTRERLNSREYYSSEEEGYAVPNSCVPILLANIGLRQF